MSAPLTAPVLSVNRHRLLTDGDGVTTLVGFHGCPLRCRYCLNPFSFAPETPRKTMTPEELYTLVKVDELYFLATGGGVTFGGGEPLLHAAFIRKFRTLCGSDWRLYAETSLHVPKEAVLTAASCVDRFIVDIKDTDPAVYRRYTGQDNALVLDNLRTLLDLVGSDRVTVRLPLIPDINTDADRRRSRQLLQTMGVTRFDEFTYVRRNKR